MNAVAISSPESRNVAPFPAFGEGGRESSRSDIAGHADETAQVADGPVTAVVMREIGGIAHLIIAFPLFLFFCWADVFSLDT